MKYFIPEWGDRVDPKYDFITDTYSKQHSEDAEKNDNYIWDIFGIKKVPIDGVLVSRTKLEENKRKLQRIKSLGFHEFLHLPKYFEIIGDCGAFGYINKDEPTFKTKDTLDYYLDIDVNVGVSIDHLIVTHINRGEEKIKLTDEENQARWDITIDNAKDMFELWKSKDRYKENIRLMGVAQGWDTDSYSKAVQELLKIGYDYIGVGGLVRAPSGNLQDYGTSKTVSNVMRAVCHTTKKWTEKNKSRVDIHIFGFARLNLIRDFHLMGVTTFDSASHLRSAWLGGRNYFTDDKPLTAIRIPHHERTRSRRKIDEELSTRAMITLRKYDAGEVDLKETLDIVLEVGEKADISPNHLEGVEETLQRQFWKDCSCPICTNYGIETVIFRGNERNRRRGFHNTNSFYKKFRKISPKVLIITNCTGKKDEATKLIPAYGRYSASPLFKTFWNQVHDFPADIMILSAKYGFINWSTQIPDYDQKMVEDQVDDYVSEFQKRLSSYEKVFFIVLGLYRKIFQKIKETSSRQVEIYPKKELTTRTALDVIEYTKQMKYFRQGIVEEIGNPLSSQDLLMGRQESLLKFQ